MEIRLLNNNDFAQLAQLTVEMYKEVDPEMTEFQSIHTLATTCATKPDFLGFGLFDDGVLIGFVTGWALVKKMFYFSGIYVILKNNEWTKKLIDFSFAYIEEHGYSGWECDAANNNIASIMEKYGAVVKYTKYHKEFK